MRLVAALEAVLDPIVALLDALHAHFDPDLAPLDILELTTGWLGWPTTSRSPLRSCASWCDAPPSWAGCAEPTPASSLR